MGTFNVYYICMGKTAWSPPPAWQPLPCYKAILTMERDSIQDPLAAKPRWYCSCGSRYMVRNGVLIEMVHGLGNSARYAFADFPLQGIPDVMSALVEERFRQCSVPHEPPLKSRRCHDTAFLVPTGKRGEYQMRRDMIAGIPKLDWNQLYTLVEAQPRIPASASTIHLMSINQVADIFSPMMHILRECRENEEALLAAAERYQRREEQEEAGEVSSDFAMGDISG